MKSQRFALLDCLRGIAAVMVVLYHIIEILPWENYPQLGTFAGFARVGWMGVDLFFVLSGFVITNLLLRMRTLNNRDFFIEFMKRRLNRVAPLYLLTGTVFTIFVIPPILFEPTLPTHIITHLFFIHDWLPSTHGSINGSNWSIAVEIQFYLLCAVFHRRLINGNPFFILLTFIGLAWAWRAGCCYTQPYLPADSGLTLFFTTTKIFGLLDGFGIGIFLARILLDPSKINFFTGIRIRAEVAVACIALIYASAITFYQNASYWNNSYMVIFWRTALALSCGGIILLFALLSSNTLLCKLMRPMRYLGEISYGIYLWHLPVILALKTVKMGDDPMRFSISVFATTFILASMSWHLFEKKYLAK